jgi:hypothetical protein
MSASPIHPTLRLVHGDDAGVRRPSAGRQIAEKPGGAERIPSARDRAAERIARENQSAASLGALDPRWMLAVQTVREIQGGRAAVITPEGRRRLLLVGNRLGLRSFDTNLVIAIVQDGARCGEDPLGTAAVGRLRLVGRDPELADARTGLSWSMVAGLVIAAGLFGSAITLVVLRVLG